MSSVDQRRDSTFARYAQHVNPARANVLSAMNMTLVADKSSGYRLWDLNGAEYLDLDLRAGVYNLGHRNPIVAEALQDALKQSDMGFALFPGEKQAKLAEQLAKSTNLQYTLFAPSGTEANDMAIQVARRVTGRRRILSCGQGYHGATGLASAAGNQEFAGRFNSRYPDDFPVFSVGDHERIEAELAMGDVAALLIEPTCNAAAYPALPEDFWQRVSSACQSTETLLIMDEIVTGLGRTGFSWGFQGVGVEPDMVVTAKGLSGGIYPIAALMMSSKVGAWLHEDFAGFAGTFAGGELASAVGLAALELSTSEDTLKKINQNADSFFESLKQVCAAHSWVKEVRQVGLLYSIILDRPDAGILLIAELFNQGVLTFPAAHAGDAVNIKLGHLVDDEFCDQAISRIAGSLKRFGDSL